MKSAKRVRRRKAGIVVAATLALGAVAAVPSVQAGSYLGLDLTALDHSRAGEDADVERPEPTGLRGRLGIRLGDVFDLEAQLAAGVDDELAGVDEWRSSIAGVYLKGHLPIGSRSALYALGGVAAVRETRSIGALEDISDRRGFSWGVGLETELSTHIDLSADWMRYAPEESGFDEVSAVSLGLKFYF